MSEPSKTITPAAPAWSPDQPLRADATDEQMYKRRIWILRNLPLMNDGQISVKMAREFAVAAALPLHRIIGRLNDELDALRATADAEPTPTATALAHRLEKFAHDFEEDYGSCVMRDDAGFLDSLLTYLRGGAPASGETP